MNTVLRAQGRDTHKRVMQCALCLAVVLCGLTPPCKAAASPTTEHAAVQRAGETLIPGMTIERAFGPVTLQITVDARLAQVEVDVFIQDRMLARETLTPEAAAARIDVLDGSTGMRGSLAVQFDYPGRRSTLLGDFVTVQARAAVPYRGEIVDWISPNQWLLKSEVHWLTPEIRSVANVTLGPDQSVEVTFYAGSQVIKTVSLSQGANDVTLNTGFHVGTAQIEPGLTLHLQPATPQQSGEVQIDGNFASSNLPHVHYAGDIVIWTNLNP